MFSRLSLSCQICLSSNLSLFSQSCFLQPLPPPCRPKLETQHFLLAAHPHASIQPDPSAHPHASIQPDPSSSHHRPAANDPPLRHPAAPLPSRQRSTDDPTGIPPPPLPHARAPTAVLPTRRLHPRARPVRSPNQPASKNRDQAISPLPPNFFFNRTPRLYCDDGVLLRMPAVRPRLP